MKKFLVVIIFIMMLSLQAVAVFTVFNMGQETPHGGCAMSFLMDSDCPGDVDAMAMNFYHILSLKSRSWTVLAQVEAGLTMLIVVGLVIKFFFSSAVLPSIAHYRFVAYWRGFIDEIFNCWQRFFHWLARHNKLSCLLCVNGRAHLSV